MARDPGKAKLERLIRSAGGNLARVAALLGASRPSVYTWIHKHGLARVAGVSSLDELDSKEAINTGNGRQSVKSFGSDRPILVDMSSATQLPPDLKMGRTVQLSVGLWKWIRRYAIDHDRSASDVAEEALQRFRDDAERGDGQ